MHSVALPKAHAAFLKAHKADEDELEDDEKEDLPSEAKALSVKQLKQLRCRPTATA